MPKLSVIIPVYNASEFLPQTLDSILNQSFRDIEVICVDDGSSDNSPDIVREYERKDSRVMLICQPNSYAGAARNNGLRHASGEYVHFLDADDYVLDHAYEALYHTAVANDLDCLKFQAICLDTESGTLVDRVTYSYSNFGRSAFNCLLPLEKGSPLLRLNVIPWSGIYRRSFLLEKGITYNHLFCVNDRSFFSRVMTNTDRIMLVRDRLVVHRISMAGSLVGGRARHFDCQFRSVEIISRQLVEDKVEPEMAAHLIRREFIDLFVWFDRFRADPVLGPKIIRQTKEFVESYDGLSPELLREMFEKHCVFSEEDEVPQITFTPIDLHDEPEAPKISVLLPFGNDAPRMHQTLFNLTSLAMEGLEFVCVDVGGNDCSAAMVGEYVDLDHRFRLVSGACFADGMNKALQAARGKYVTFLAPGDMIEDTLYPSLLKSSADQKLDITLSNSYSRYVDVRGKFAQKVHAFSDCAEDYNRNFAPADEPECLLRESTLRGCLFTKSYLTDAGITFQPFDADCSSRLFWLQAMACSKKVRALTRADLCTEQPLFDHIGAQDPVFDLLTVFGDWVAADANRSDALTKSYIKLVYTTLMQVYAHLPQQERADYLCRIRAYLLPLQQSGLLTEDCFEPFDWLQLPQIMADPRAYAEKVQVSVIIPVYNAENYIRANLDSLLGPNPLHIEVICINDSSPDNSLAILEEYAARDSRVTVVSQPNGGAGAGRNRGMSMAHGEYYSFLDSDDFFEPGMLYKSYVKSVLNQADITVFRCDMYNDALKQFNPAPYSIKRNMLPQSEPFAGMDIPKDRFNVLMGWAWDKLFRAEFVKETGLKFQEQRTTNDIFFVLSSLIAAKRIVTMDDVFAHRRIWEGSLTATRNLSWFCFYQALSALKEQFIAWGIYEELRQDFFNAAVNRCLWNVTTIKGPNYFLLFEKLQGEWGAYLELFDHEADYFYHPEEYTKLMLLRDSTAMDFLFAEMDAVRVQSTSLRTLNGRLKEQLERAQERVQTISADRSEINRKLQITYGEKAERGIRIRELERENKQLAQKLQETKAKLKAEKATSKKLNKQLKRIRKTLPYRIARKLRSLLKKLLGRG